MPSSTSSSTESVADEVQASELAAHGAAVLSAEETERFMAEAFEPDGDLKMWFIGQSAEKIAAAAGLEKPGAKLIVFEADASNPAGAQARERLAPVLSFFTVDGDDEAIALCRALLSYEGAGHTANVHTGDPARAERFAAAMPASRDPGQHAVGARLLRAHDRAAAHADAGLRHLGRQLDDQQRAPHGPAQRQADGPACRIRSGG